MKMLIELFFGEWECVVAEVVGNDWLLVCHRHTITRRVTGYLDKGNCGKRKIETSVVMEHIKRYAK